MLSNDSRILVVDDFELVREMLKQSLAALGFSQVDEAVDGKQAFSMLEEAFRTGKPYDLVFSDWNMPNMTGIELLNACRNLGRFKSLPIVMVTAEGEQPHVVQALRAGATDYLVKPISQEVLQKKIQKISQRIGNKAA